MTTQTETRARQGESFASLFEDSIKKADALKEGDIVSGTVLSVGNDNVVVDIGYKSEGVIPLREFESPTGEYDVAPGQVIEVLIESRETDDGHIILSKRKADRVKVWDEIREACTRDEIIQGTVTGKVKGGLRVIIRGGVEAFLPGSQIDIRPVRNLDRMLGQTMDFKVINFHPERGNIVLSRRVLLETERNELRAKTLEHLEEGMVVSGVIKNLTQWGAFVDLGGIDGLLHAGDMTWGRRPQNPADIFRLGDEVTVKVLKYVKDGDKTQISLGLKQTQDDPWNTASERYTPGMKITGKVTENTHEFGAFIQMEPGLEGLVRKDDLTWKKNKHPSKIVEIGQEVEAVVLEVDALNRRINLGLKQLEPDPWNVFTTKYNPGDIIRGKVRSVTDYGVFVGIEDGVDGMVHKSDLSWTQRIENPADVYRKGDEVEAIILSINHEDRKVSLGVKQLYEDPWQRIPTDYPIGTMLEVRVVSISDRPPGVFAEIERGVEAFAPISELSYDRIDDPRTVIAEGQVVKAEIINLNSMRREITLSFKKMELEGVEAIKFSEERGALEPAVRKAAPASGKSGATLGDLLKEKFGNNFGASDDSDN